MWCICCESTSENSDIDSFKDSSTDNSMSEHLSSVTCVDSDMNELPQSWTQCDCGQLKQLSERTCCTGIVAVSANVSQWNWG